MVLPGGFGVAKNFSDFAFKGKEMKVDEQVKNILEKFRSKNKPIAATCIAPIILSKVFGNVKLTLGKKSQEFPYSDAIEAAKEFGS